MFAYPGGAALRSAVLVDVLGWRALVTVGKRVTRHYLGVAIRPAQHEHVGQVVEITILVGQHIAATGTVATLVVMVVGEYNGITAGEESPALTKGVEVGQLLVLEDVADGRAVAELGDV